MLRAGGTLRAGPAARLSTPRLAAPRLQCQPCRAAAEQSPPVGLRQRAIRGLERLGQATLGVAAAAAVLLPAPALAEQTVLSFPVSSNPEVFDIQRTLVEAWTICTEAFVDPHYNGVDWVGELSGALNAAADASTPKEAQREIAGLLGKLGDPFTRWVPPQSTMCVGYAGRREYQDFRVGSDGELQGVGLLIAADPSSGRLVVLAPIKGSPADRAGIQPGDQVVSVNGDSTEGWDNDNLAKHLRGTEGSAVWVEVARQRGEGEQIPGVAGIRYTQQDPNVDRKIFRLLRTKLEFSPVFAAPIQFDGHTFGYLRLVNFSMKAPAEMEKAVAQLKRDGAEAFILDLRNNPGGLVRASMDIAGLWMDGNQHPTIFNIEDREGTHSTIARVVLDSGLALTDQPLVVLVNKQSASASEILAAALHDNHRAVVLGEPTFGKGKIQSVFELSDGSALFVTVAKYMTPAGNEIDKIGVQPDKACSPQPNGPAAVPGIPVGPGASERVLEELGFDDCVLSAQSLLEHQVDDYWKSSGGHAPMLVAAPPLMAASA